MRADRSLCWLRRCVCAAAHLAVHRSYAMSLRCIVCDAGRDKNNKVCVSLCVCVSLHVSIHPFDCIRSSISMYVCLQKRYLANVHSWLLERVPGLLVNAGKCVVHRGNVDRHTHTHTHACTHMSASLCIRAGSCIRSVHFLVSNNQLSRHLRRAITSSTSHQHVSVLKQLSCVECALNHYFPSSNRHDWMFTNADDCCPTKQFFEAVYALNDDEFDKHIISVVDAFNCSYLPEHDAGDEHCDCMLSVTMCRLRRARDCKRGVISLRSWQLFEDWVNAGRPSPFPHHLFTGDTVNINDNTSEPGCVCKLCKQRKTKSEYTSSQLRKLTTNRVCKSCSLNTLSTAVAVIDAGDDDVDSINIDRCRINDDGVDSINIDRCQIIDDDDDSIDRYQSLFYI